MDNESNRDLDLPLPLSAAIAQVVGPKSDENGNWLMPATADDEVSGNTTYTDD